MRRYEAKSGSDLSHASDSFSVTNTSTAGDGKADREDARPAFQPKKRRSRASLVDDLGPRIFADTIRDAPAGSLLPHEGALAERYQVSRATVRSAMRDLQEAGYVLIRQGVGTTVLPRSRALDAGMDALLSFETLAKRHHTEISTVDIVIERAAIPAAVAPVLGLPLESEGTLVQRAKLLDGSPVAWMIDFVPATVLSMETIAAHFSGSVLDVLMAEAPAEVGYADCDVLPLQLPADIAARLSVAPGTIALSMEEVTHTPEGNALAWGRSWMLPSKLRFALRRRRRFS